MGFEVFNFIDRKMAGMSLVCNTIADGLKSKAKHNAKWKDTSEDGKTKNTAHARQGITSGATGGNGNYNIYLAHSVSYGQILEEGSKPHTITPKNKPYLCFRGSDGYWKRAKVVHHPGTKGFHTFQEEFEKNKDNIIEDITKYWSD